MSLIKRKNSPYWQYDFTLDGQRFRGSTGETGKREAKAVEDDYKQAVRNGKPKGRAWTLQAVCETYWAEHARDKASATTIWNQLLQLAGRIGKHRPITAITNATIMDYRAKRRGDGLQQHSINREVTILRAAFNHVANLHKAEIPDLAWAALKKDEPPPRQFYLTMDQFSTLLDASHSSIRPILICAVSTGLRKSNILTLDWKQVRLSERRITMTVKGGKIHEVRITPFFLPTLFAMPNRKGRVFDTTNFEKRWKAARIAAGMPEYRFHDLRHTFASWARQLGADIADVKDALGHSDISMTLRYAHIKPDAHDTAFDKVSAALSAHSTSQSLQNREN